MKKDLLIIIPAYNEEECIEDVLDALECPEIREIADVLIMNDASSDNTSWIAKKRKYKVITHVFNLGYGSAIQLGYKYAVRRRYDYVIQMDADGQHDVNNIPRIYEELKKADADGRYPDIVLGSRFLPGSSEFHVGGCKKFAIRLFRHYIRRHTHVSIQDPTSGLQGLRFPAFLYYSKYGHFDERYPDANMILQMLLLGYRIREIPATMHARETGKSMHSGLRPIGYMLHMACSLLWITYQYQFKKKDAGIGESGAISTKKYTDEKTEIYG
ncbi:MAG: glycosyltransferase family 2 protein [Lachnospiraceae bacterium]|nr:glycosyltransferase family 2 protein [Lachnospiraceae bacterium]